MCLGCFTGAWLPELWDYQGAPLSLPGHPHGSKCSLETAEPKENHKR